VSTEAELTRVIEDVNQYLEQVGWWVQAGQLYIL
jgi:hypothetical protein